MSRHPNTWRALTVAALLMLCALLATPYARAVAPFYGAIAGWWCPQDDSQMLSLKVVRDDLSPATSLRLVAAVRGARSHYRQAIVVSRVQVGAVAETLLMFWMPLLLWPMPLRRRLWTLVLALPLFATVDACMTVGQLLAPIAQTAADLMDGAQTITAWTHWSQFLEQGGRFVCEVCAALMVIAVATRRGAGSVVENSTTSPATVRTEPMLSAIARLGGAVDDPDQVSTGEISG